MRITKELIKTDDGKTEGFAVFMTCGTFEEFMTNVNMVADVEGVELSGCPDESEEYYRDQIAYIEKSDYTNVELQEVVGRIVKECKDTLKR